MPSSFTEEQFSRIGNDITNSWPYTFTRQSVMDYLMSFSTLNPSAYNDAYTLVTNAVTSVSPNEVKVSYVLKTLGGKLSVTNADFSRCRQISPNRNKKHDEVQFYTAFNIFQCHYWIVISFFAFILFRRKSIMLMIISLIYSLVRI